MFDSPYPPFGFFILYDRSERLFNIIELWRLLLFSDLAHGRSNFIFPLMQSIIQKRK